MMIKEYLNMWLNGINSGEKTLGLGNKVGNKYMVFLDYDNVGYIDVLNDLNRIKSKFDLHTYCVFITKKGFHVIFFDLVNYNKLLKIFNYSKKMDKKYILSGMVNEDIKNHIWVIRLGSKNGEFPVFLTGELTFKNEFAAIPLLLINKKFNLIDNKDIVGQEKANFNKAFLCVYKIKNEYTGIISEYFHL